MKPSWENVEPLGKMLLLEQHEWEGLASGLEVPEGARSIKPWATVIRKGPDCSDRIQVGDLVMYNPQAIKIGCTEPGDKKSPFRALFTEDQIVGIVKKKS